VNENDDELEARGLLELETDRLLWGDLDNVPVEEGLGIGVIVGDEEMDTRLCVDAGVREGGGEKERRGDWDVVRVTVIVKIEGEALVVSTDGVPHGDGEGDLEKNRLDDNWGDKEVGWVDEGVSV